MKKSVLFLLLTLLGGALHAQGARHYEPFLEEAGLVNTVSFLSDDLNTGRASGTIGNSRAERYISQRFKSLGLKPYRWNYTQSFLYKDSIVLRNVVGILTAAVPSDEFIVVSAHYDHLGELHGTIYNGADDNASGVAAMLGIAELFSRMKADGKGPAKNIIFVAFDGKELSLSGSKYFVKHLAFPYRKIVADINIDIIGTNLVPIGKNPNYIMAIGEESLPQRYRGCLKNICLRKDYRMDAGLDFYGSKDFTRMVYQNGDHNSFRTVGIPAVFFTSGFHQHTYKATDDIDIIDFELLRKRTLVIFNYVNNLCN